MELKSSSNFGVTFLLFIHEALSARHSQPFKWLKENKAQDEAE